MKKSVVLSEPGTPIANDDSRIPEPRRRRSSAKLRAEIERVARELRR